MDEMIYTDHLTRMQTLEINHYHNILYIVASYGTHPCAYIFVPYDEYISEERLESVECCNGGITYNEKGLHNSMTECQCIGWDYAHSWDRIGDWNSGKEWSTEEIVYEIKKVIEFLWS